MRLQRRVPETCRAAALAIGPAALLWLAALLPALAPPKAFGAEPRLEVIAFSSRALADNPLHDPVVRPVAVFIPAQGVNGEPLPVVYYLPGYGNHAGTFIRHSSAWLKFTQRIADEITPMLLVVVDGRTRWGGSQYLNSPAQGNYEDYVCKEIVPQVEAHHPVPAKGVRRIIAGHSSGGFGALRLGSAEQKLFDAVVALSPDSDFPDTHLPLVTLPGVAHATLSEVQQIAAGRMPVPDDDDLTYALGLSAAYAPRRCPNDGRFEWLYDAEGHFRGDVWRRWLDNDPLTIIRNDPHAFRPGQAIYLDGAAHDEYSANVGAEKIYEVLRDRAARCTFYESPGQHSDAIRERLRRGLAWVFKRSIR